MSRRVLKFITGVLSCAIILAFVLPSVSNVFASENGEFIVEKEKYISVLNAIENSVEKRGSDFVVDKAEAADYGLTIEEINNLQDYLNVSSNSEVENTLKTVPEEKQEAQKEESAYYNVASAASNPLSKVFKAVVYTMVGVAIGRAVVTDAYKLGAYKACHKWGKKHPKVKKACKLTGHW